MGQHINDVTEAIVAYPIYFGSLGNMKAETALWRSKWLHAIFSLLHDNISNPYPGCRLRRFFFSGVPHMMVWKMHSVSQSFLWSSKRYVGMKDMWWILKLAWLARLSLVLFNGKSNAKLPNPQVLISAWTANTARTKKNTNRHAKWLTAQEASEIDLIYKPTLKKDGQE